MAGRLTHKYLGGDVHGVVTECGLARDMVVGLGDMYTWDDMHVTCPNCALTFPSEHAVRIALGIDRRLCPECGTHFAEEWELDLHLYSHRGDYD